MLHFLYYIFGISGTGSWYAFWSGIGSDIGEIAIFSGLISLYRKHNCHAKGCWRLGRHPVAGTPYTVCRHHHPEGAPTHQKITAAFHAAKKRGS